MRSRVRAMLLGLVGVAVIGVVDFVTGPDFGFAFFYLIPIMPVAWYAGRWPGLVVAAASAAMWFTADAVVRPQAVASIAWNASSRLAIFLGAAVLIDRVSQDRRRMRLIDAQRDDFLRVLEHELAVPAQEMVAALNTVQAAGTLDAVGIEALRHRAESLLFLTRDFVALGRAQAQRLTLRQVPVDIAQVVTEIARDRADRGEVLVSVPGDGLVVTADPERLHQAIANIVAEVLREAGSLDYVSVHVRSRGAEAEVSVSAAAATATRSTDDAPLPVSLRLARLLVEAMGGSMSVERASLGKGLRVNLRLPRSVSASAESSQEARPSR